MATVKETYDKQYKSGKEAREDWERGAEFITSSIDIGFGQLCSKRDFAGNVTIRFDEDRKFVIVKGEKQND